MCETKEQAEAIVRACKYPSKTYPNAIRGTGAMIAPQNFNQTGREYLLSANDNIVICVQIETRLAVNNVDAIAAVDGIDALFVGPNDLASSMGYVAFDHASIAEVQDASRKVLEAAKAAGKYAGHFALSAEAGTCVITDSRYYFWAVLTRIGVCSSAEVQSGMAFYECGGRYRCCDGLDVEGNGYFQIIDREEGR